MNQIQIDQLDKSIEKTTRLRVPETADAIRRGKQHLATFDSLIQDVFHAYHKDQPEFTEAEPTGTAKYAREELSKLMESPAYKELKETTTWDAFSSALAQQATAEELAKQMESDPELRKLLNELSKGNDQAIEQNQKILRRVINLGAEKALEKVEEADDLLVGLFGPGWGCGAGLEHDQPAEEKLKLLQQVKQNKTLKELSKLLGRLKCIARGTQASKAVETKLEIHSITTGDEFGRLLPQEILAMQHPTLRADFWRRFTEKQLLQYDLNDHTPIGRGPITVLVDDSGSMNEHYKGFKLSAWARATILALQEIAKAEKRDLGVCIHSDIVEKTYYFEGGEASPQEIIELGTKHYGGGTSYDEPLAWAIEQIEKNPKLKKADILLITDGDCDVYRLDWLLEKKKELGFRIHIAIYGNHRLPRFDWADSQYDRLDEENCQEMYTKIGGEQ